ncbi:hypothetical protein [Paenibacillus sp. KR2-11]|uniref:hypothetical protein n=1 Tax=Paenibacillus sp. KR2-11 TaxID=3385500 RepID=UPI0038FD2A18
MAVFGIAGSLFPEATAADIKVTKSYLTGYGKMKRAVEYFEENAPNSLKAQSDFERFKRITKKIERAIGLICDDEIRRIMTFRFLKENTRAATVIMFNIITDRTVDRKINEGIAIVADCLLLWEELY